MPRGHYLTEAVKDAICGQLASFLSVRSRVLALLARVTALTRPLVGMVGGLNAGLPAGL